MMKAMVQEIQSEMECNSWERMKAQYAGEIQIYIYISSPNLRKRVDLIKTMATYLWVLYDFRKGKTQKSVQHMHTCVRVRAYAHACVCGVCGLVYVCVVHVCVWGLPIRYSFTQTYFQLRERLQLDILSIRWSYIFVTGEFYEFHKKNALFSHR